MKLRIRLFAIGLALIIATLFPFLNLYLGGYVYEGYSVADILDLLRQHPECSDMAYLFAGIVGVVGFMGASGISNGRRLDVTSPSASSPSAASTNTDGTPMANGAIDVTGHTFGSPRH